MIRKLQVLFLGLFLAVAANAGTVNIKVCVDASHRADADSNESFIVSAFDEATTGGGMFTLMNRPILAGSCDQTVPGEEIDLPDAGTYRIQISKVNASLMNSTSVFCSLHHYDSTQSNWFITVGPDFSNFLAGPCF